jgi:hypothetical protein
MSTESDWRPIETAPDTGFFLTYEDGAMRTSFRNNGKWEPVDIPVLVTRHGDRLVSRELSGRGESLELSGCPAREPSHWMPLPEAPLCERD